MQTSTITLDGNTVTLVPLPTTPRPRMVEPWASDSVAVITFPFTGQTQAQGATGADLWGMMVTYAPMTDAQASPLLAWLLQMRGMACASQLAPPEYAGPQGTPSGSPKFNGAQTAAATSIVTNGWPASTNNLLLPFDCIQIGYRLHRCLDVVDSDGGGNATINIWPSLREDVATGTSIVYTNPVALFRLAANKRNWSKDYTRLTHLSFPLVEYR